MSWTIDFAIFGAGQGGRCFLPSHAVAFKRYAVRIVDDPVEYGICDHGFSHHVMLLRDRQLGGDQR
jgi:hypothetical protein